MLYYQMLLLSFLLILLFSGSDSATFTLTNRCSYTVWPGILSNGGIQQLPTTGFALQPGESTSIPVPKSWSGRLWGRTYCTQNATTGIFSCLTGDCGSSTIECSGRGAAPPATLAEFTLNGFNNLDFYDVSLVDGYNLPMSIAPQGASGGNCSITGCGADLNAACPSALAVIDSKNGERETIACKSACNAFGDPQYCCSGAYGNPNTCKSSNYSKLFKNACPKAYSYAYDDATSTFTCIGANYDIDFCPSTSSSLKSANGQLQEAASISIGHRETSPYAIGGTVTLFATIWRLWQLF